MSWLQKLLPPTIKSTPGEREDAGARRAVDQVPVVRGGALPHRPREEPATSARSATTTTASARASASTLLDPEGRYEIGHEVVPVDSLKFKDSASIPSGSRTALEETGETDALVVMQGSVKSVPVVLAAFEFDFMGGSMGSVVGERFVRGVRVASRTAAVHLLLGSRRRAHAGRPHSLMQMAKTTAVLHELDARRACRSCRC